MGRAVGEGEAGAAAAPPPAAAPLVVLLVAPVPALPPVAPPALPPVVLPVALPPPAPPLVPLVPPPAAPPVVLFVVPAPAAVPLLHTAEPAALVCGAVHGTHAVAVDWPVRAFAVLAEQFVGAVAPTGQYAPAGHSVQEAVADAANEPAEQLPPPPPLVLLLLLQAEDPAALVCGAVHCLHAVAADCSICALKVLAGHCVGAVAFAGHQDPVGQGEGAVAPAAHQKDAGHARQVPPAGAKLPAGQLCASAGARAQARRAPRRSMAERGGTRRRRGACAL